MGQNAAGAVLVCDVWIAEAIVVVLLVLMFE
jgi:hypothetical protein